MKLSQIEKRIPQTSFFMQSTEGTLTGDRTHNVQRLVDVVTKQKPELAPVQHHSTVVIIAVAWDHLCLQGSATTSNVKIRKVLLWRQPIFN